jgi:hypothetical protein
LGVAIQYPNHEYAFEPAFMDERVMNAIMNMNLPVALSMSSDITSNLFTKISSNQTELVIQLRGARIPILDSLQEILARRSEVIEAMACLVREENVVLLWANTIDHALPHCSDIEQMLMETVSYCCTCSLKFR